MRAKRQDLQERGTEDCVCNLTNAPVCDAEDVCCRCSPSVLSLLVDICVLF